MTNNIHPTAIIEAGARIGKDVKIGPYCIIGNRAHLDDEVELKSHVVIDGDCFIGKGTIIHPFASIGGVPQDLKYRGEESKTIIGQNNVIREYVTIQRGTLGGKMVTEVGNNCLFMVGVHIAHNCNIGNSVVIANYASLAGHVEVGDHAIIGGLAAIHQFVRVGSGAILGGLSGLGRDLIPYGLASNEASNLKGLNLIGMRRRNIDNATITEASRETMALFERQGNLIDKVEALDEKSLNNHVIKEIVNFIKHGSTRAFCAPKVK